MHKVEVPCAYGELEHCDVDRRRASVNVCTMGQEEIRKDGVAGSYSQLER